jgi:hypothetical protein
MQPSKVLLSVSFWRLRTHFPTLFVHPSLQQTGGDKKIWRAPNPKFEVIFLPISRRNPPNSADFQVLEAVGSAEFHRKSPISIEFMNPASPYVVVAQWDLVGPLSDD